MSTSIFARIGESRLSVSLVALVGAVGAVVACRAIWRASRSRAAIADSSGGRSQSESAGVHSSQTPENVKTTSERRSSPSTGSRKKASSHQQSESDPLLEPGTTAAQHQRSSSGHSQQRVHAHKHSSSGNRPHSPKAVHANGKCLAMMTA